MGDRIPAEVELAWDSFHQVVNMSSDELRTWLLTVSSGEEAFPASRTSGCPNSAGRSLRCSAGARST